MQLDPKKRISAQDALDHPWFDRFCPAITLKHQVKPVEELQNSLKFSKTPNDLMMSRSQTLYVSEETTNMVVYHPFGTFPKD